MAGDPRVEVLGECRRPFKTCPVKYQRIHWRISGIVGAIHVRRPQTFIARAMLARDSSIPSEFSRIPRVAHGCR